MTGFVPGGYANVTYADGAKIMTWREHFDNPGSLERFAELIIRECMSVARGMRNPPNLNYKPSDRFVDELRLHFGVKE